MPVRHSEVQAILRQDDLAEVVVNRLEIDVAFVVAPAVVGKILKTGPGNLRVFGAEMLPILKQLFPLAQRLIAISVLKTEGQQQLLKRSARLSILL